MNLDTYLHRLQFETDKLSPPDWEADWDDAPLSYKLYCNLPVFPLSLEVPLTLENMEQTVKPNHNTIGYFLWYVYGLSQVSQSLIASEMMQSFRRFPPSGGGLYPNELYVYLNLEDVPTGVYHYDVAHHQLILLREGNFEDYISKALGNRYDFSTSFAIAIVSTMFWENFFKYHNFSYRLQGLDAGVVIGQLLEVAKRFGFETSVYFQFLDRAINHLLGLSEKEESTYALIPLSVKPTKEKSTNRLISATELCRELPEIQCNHFVKSQRIKDYPMLVQINEASMIESTKSFRQLSVQKHPTREEKVLKLPQVKSMNYDLAAACRKRFSPEMDFTWGKVSQLQLASLLQETTANYSYQNDIDGEQNQNQQHRVSLSICIDNVEGIPSGAYHYDNKTHTLKLIQLGDFRLQLQNGMTLDNVNLYPIPLCFHVIGNKDFFKNELGYRGYRIQQMEAGMLVQRLLLVASAIGLGGHPLLGFNVKNCDDIYKLESEGMTTLIQIPIGLYRLRPWLKGSLLS